MIKIWNDIHLEIRSSINLYRRDPLACSALCSFAIFEMVPSLAPLQETQGKNQIARPDQLGMRSCGGFRRPLFRVMKDIL